ncbi:small subunit processome component 20 homolog [Anopheles ziemanni]|uniref:small subunit processome component 20 homolog n=1 Tax=Anopheles coustani TaxID=139045 RepID=UPI00265A94FF|nr:small subunit processome component 20 homolog [Anopheles coustani]XP_058178150.1 small subunit processome component 20 homolog [Anopheles ziemanni]
MKNRPKKHTASNKFHFQSFRDRINEIDVRRGALYRVETDYELPETDEGTYFHQALKKWSVQNLSSEYVTFQSGFKESFTLPLLLFNKDAIVEHLVACLRETTDSALQPLLELVVALAKDLRKDFHAYFSRLFEVLVEFLHSASADRVEWTLLCLAHLFKILRSVLRSDFGLTFNNLVPLLDETSSPPHAVDFATECLGYLARDLKDKRQLVELLLKWQMKHDAYTVACGKLLFEVLHGVQEHFHTSAKQTLLQLFEIMEQLEETEADHLQEILTQTITDVVECIQPEDIPVFWDVVRVSIDSYIVKLGNENVANKEHLVKHLTRLLQLSGIVLEYREGRLLGDALSSTVSQLIKLITTVSSPGDEFNETVVNQIIVLLRSKHVRLTQLEASRLTMNVLMLDHRPLYERFVAATVNCPMFEALIWPNFVKMLEAELDDARIRFLAGLLLQKAPLCGNGFQLENWKPFPVQVLANGNLERYMNKLLTVEHVEMEFVLANSELYLSALIALPHLANFRAKQNAVSTLKDTITYAVQFVQQDKPNKSTNKLIEKIIPFLGVTVETIIHMKEIEGKEYFDLLERLLPLVMKQDCLLLNTIHLLVTFMAEQRKSLLTFARFERMRPFIHPLLFSYDMSVRRLASGILAKFEHLSELAVAMGPLYSTIAKIENIEPLVQTYRGQVILFQHLAYDSQMYQQAANVARNEWTETVLQYMLSTFAVNFKLLWAPAASIVQSYGDNMVKSDEQLFWKVFDSMMRLAEGKQPHADCQSSAPADEEDEQTESMDTEDDTVDRLFPKVIDSFMKKPNIDYHNIRIQLLRTLQQCSYFCRSKGDSIAERFFAFLESKESKTNAVLGEEPTETKVDSEIRRKSSKGAGIGTQQVLLCYLNICTELGRKSLRKHASRLYTVYETLASSRNEEIQKAALNGIFAFGDEQLVPYKDFIFRLTSEKTLKNALLSVFVPTEDEPEDEDGDDDGSAVSGRTKIAEEHRPKVVQLMLKVLDGKITQNLGGTGSGGPFRATILTFIGRLRKEELEMLLNRWFEPYLKQLKETPIATVRSLAGEEENAAVVPIPATYRTNTLLHLLSSILTEVAPLQQAAFAARVLHLKIFFDALLMRMDHSIYRKYKTQALLSLVEVFKQYEQSEEYDWTDEELQAIMHVHVWPLLENLPSDSIHSPTPLLKLLLVWSRSERLYMLLSRRRYDNDKDAGSDHSMTPLDAMIALLKGSQTSAGVCTEVFNALASMLECDSLVGDQDEDVGRSATVASGDRLSHRNRLLIPYVKELLQHIRQTLKSKKSISSNMLLILTRIAESGMIGSDQQSEDAIEDDRKSLLSLLFPILAKKVAALNEISSDHIEASLDVRRLHVIIMRLLKEISTPQQYLKQLATLLETVKDVVSRKTIMQMFENMAPLSPELMQISTLVQELNAMDKRWIDQPDHSARTAGYRSIDPMVAADAPAGQRMTGNVAIVFLSHALHVFQFEKELSARQNAIEYACKVIAYLATAQDERPGDVQYCVERIVLRGITSGLKMKRSSNDRRNESIQLLAEVTRQVGALKRTVRPECRIFAELWQFTGKLGGGNEGDFFENITHLQLHYHRKALKRLADKLGALVEKAKDVNGIPPKGPSPRVIVQFLLPIVSHYNCNEVYKKQTNLVEEAGNCIIHLSRFLPWRSYHSVLKLHLTKLRYSWEYQKQMLRIVIGIMDAFHFDLSTLSSAPEEEDEKKSDGEHNSSPVAGNALMDKKLMLPTDVAEDTADVMAEEQEKQENGMADGETENKEEAIEDEIDDAEVDDDADVTAAQVNEEDPRQLTVDERKVARAIVDDISRTIIPSLLSSFHFASEGPVTITGASAGGPSNADRKARFAKQREQMLKLPIAIAIVKLFMKLPRREIELNLPKLIIKVITFLKSRLKLARAQARNTLAHITLELGASYLSFVLQNLLAMLTRGFQRHVLTYTVHIIIERAQKHLAGGHVLADILQTVLQICMEDMFGQLIGLINGTTIEGGTLRNDSTPESKSNRKPYQTLNILARYANEQMLVDLFAPFRAVLVKFRTHQTLTKVQDAFHKLAEGIVSNESLGPEVLLTFVYGMMSGKIYTQCALANGEQESAADGDQYTARGRKLLGKVAKPGSIYLIPAEPKRYGSAAAAANLDYTLAKTEGNDHVFLECGLDLLWQALKQQHAYGRHDREVFQQRVDPIVPMLVQSLESKHTRVTCTAIECLSMLWVTKWPLESLASKETMETIMKKLFEILHRYNTIAIDDTNSTNFPIVKACFRALVSMLKNVQHLYSFTMDHQRLLVMYIEQGVAVGGGRQTMAFTLLRSIVARKLNFYELHKLMRKVFETSVRSESDSERADCRQIIMEYLMNYQLGKKLQQHLLFFVEQLQYEVLFGRESAATMLKMLFQKLPKETIDKEHNTLFFALGVRLMNESTGELRALIADTIETLLKRLTIKQKCDELIPVTQEMLQDGQIKLRELGTQLLLRLIHSEPTAEFICSWLENVQDTLLLNLVPQIYAGGSLGNGRVGMFVKPMAPVNALLHADTRGDHLIIETLLVFEQLLQPDRGVLTNDRYNYMIDSLAYTAQTLLASGHQWVRLGALKVLYQIINELDFDAIQKKLENGSNEQEEETDGEEDEACPKHGKQFFYNAPLRDSKTLTLDLCAQLTPGSGMVDEQNDEAATLVMQILFLLANMLRVVPMKDEKMSSSSKKINLCWLLRRVRYVIQNEVLKTPNIYILRKHALHWMTSVVAILEQDVLEELAPTLLIPAVRELTAQEASARRTKAAENDPAKASLLKVATTLCKDISRRLGTTTYDKIRNTLEESLRLKRTGRKAQLAREKITQPKLAARRKDQKKLRNKEAKKRKVASHADASDGTDGVDGVLMGTKRRAKGGGVPIKRKKMEALFRE